jgi:hypothetical protein
MARVLRMVPWLRKIASLGAVCLVATLPCAAPLRAADETPAGREIAPRDTAPTLPGGDRGIGGTGVVGTVTGFGSIIANGLEVGLATADTITIDGRAGKPAALKLGHVARLVATPFPGGLTARAVAVTHEIIGPVGVIDMHADIAKIAGQKVSLGAIDYRGRIRVGDFIAVNGLRRPDGIVVATLVETVPRGLVQVVGVPVRAEKGRIRLGGLTLEGGAAAALVGERALFRGRLAGGRLIVRTAAPAPTFADAARLAEVSIEGYFAREGNSLVSLSAPDLPLLGDAADLAAIATDRPQHAVVTAKLQDNGTAVITHVQTLASSAAPATKAVGATAAPGGTDAVTADPEGDAQDTKPAGRKRSTNAKGDKSSDDAAHEVGKEEHTEDKSAAGAATRSESGKSRDDHGPGQASGATGESHSSGGGHGGHGKSH